MSLSNRPWWCHACLSAAAILIWLALPCRAQYETAAVLGKLSDPSGAAIAHASVELRSDETGVKTATTTEDDGIFYFLSVKVGHYKVSASAPGFKTVETDLFPVAVNARQRVDLTLTVGDVKETVAVNGAASVVEADSSERGHVIGRQAIVDLPLNGRDYTDLALLVPGVRRSNNQASASLEGTLNVNGQPGFFNNYTLDGVDNNAYGTSKQGLSAQAIQPSPDALQEFRVETNNYSAEYGRSTGAVINVSIRSGTNQLHGSLWEYLRNTDLNAVGFFKPQYGFKPILIQNQFGAAAGGPIRKDKLFVFADYEGKRRKQMTLAYTTIPTLAQRQGNIGIPVMNPYINQIYSSGVIPASQISPFALKVMNDLPQPYVAGTVANNYEGNPSTPIQDDKGDIRVDYYASSKLSAFARYSRRMYSETDGVTLTGPDTAPNVWRIMNWQMTYGFNWIISPVSLLDFRWGTSLTDGGRIPSTLGGPSMLALYGIPGLPTDPSITGGLNGQSISGYATLGRDGSSPQHQDPFVVNPKVNYSRIFDKHVLKAGYEYQAVNTVIDDFSNKYGADTYSGQFSAPPTAASNSLYNLADFLFGARSSSASGNPDLANYRQRMHFAYVQDDFKASPRLTLNLGLRYEFATPQWEANNKLSNYGPTTNTILTAKNGSLYDQALVNPDYKDLGPRVGLAYSINGKTVVRSGYGIAYLHFNRAGGDNILAENPPFYTQNSYSQTPSLGLCSANSPPIGCFRPTDLGYPEQFYDPTIYNTLLSRVIYVPKDLKTNSTQSWHLTIQRELPWGMLLDTACVGNHSSHIQVLGDYNQAVPNLPGQNLPLQNRRPIQNYSLIQIEFSGATSTYNALQMKLEKKYQHGLYFIHSFTWAKALDNAPGHAEVSNGDDKGVDYRDLRSSKGISNYDQALANTTTLIWDIPIPGASAKSAWSRFADGAIRHWQLSAIDSILGGQPINLTYSPSSAFQVSSLPPIYRPNLIGDPMMPQGQRSIHSYFNSNTVVIPTDVTQPFGNAGRNDVRSNDLVQLDLGIHKVFPVYGERTRLDFRLEAFNALNRTNFSPASGNRSSAAFGTITSTFPARQVQFALKLLF